MPLTDYCPAVPGIVTFYGGAGTGKTSIAMEFLVATAKQGKKAVFLETNNAFSPARVHQIAGDDLPRVLQHTVLIPLNNFKQQHNVIKQLCRAHQSRLSLCIIDAINFHYRRLVTTRKELANNMLHAQLRLLSELSNNVQVIIISQVYAANAEVNMIGGAILKTFSQRIIQVMKSPRKMIVHTPEKLEVYFSITDAGLQFHDD